MSATSASVTRKRSAVARRTDSWCDPASRIAESRLLILEDAGHCAFLEEHEMLDAAIAALADEVLAPAKAAARKRRRPGVRRAQGS